LPFPLKVESTKLESGFRDYEPVSVATRPWDAVPASAFSGGRWSHQDRWWAL